MAEQSAHERTKQDAAENFDCPIIFQKSFPV